MAYMPVTSASRPPGPTSCIGVSSATTSTLVANSAPGCELGIELPKFPTSTTVERSLYSKFGVIEEASGVTTLPSFRGHPEVGGVDGAGRHGQENSTGSPAP